MVRLSVRVRVLCELWKERKGKVERSCLDLTQPLKHERGASQYAFSHRLDGGYRCHLITPTSNTTFISAALCRATGQFVG